MLTRGETKYCEVISQKDHSLRSFLANSALSECVDDARAWPTHLVGIKTVLGISAIISGLLPPYL